MMQRVNFFPCGSGFPAATIEAESLSHNEQRLPGRWVGAERHDPL